MILKVITINLLDMCKKARVFYNNELMPSCKLCISQHSTRRYNRLLLFFVLILRWLNFTKIKKCHKTKDWLSGYIHNVRKHKTLCWQTQDFCCKKMKFTNCITKGNWPIGSLSSNIEKKEVYVGSGRKFSFYISTKRQSYQSLSK